MNDKEYQQTNIRLLMTFLIERQYDSQLNPQMLNSISTRDFKIVTFIIQNIDPQFMFDESKFEEEVLMYLRMLGYPFTISKSSLKSASSPHTWPSILAALIWLIELINFLEVTESKQDSQKEADIGFGLESEQMFFEYLKNSYEAFLSGVDGDSVVEKELESMFGERNAAVLTSLKQIEQENATLEDKIQAAMENVAVLPALEKQRADLQADVIKFRKFNETLAQHKKKCDSSLADSMLERQLRQKELDDIAAETTALKQQISVQTVTPLEVQKMSQDRILLEESQMRAQTQKEELQRQIWGQEVAIAKSIDCVDRLVNEFNHKAHELEIIPATARNSNGLDLELKFTPSAPTLPQMVGVDLKAVGKPALLNMRDALADRVRQQQDDLKEQTSAKKEKAGALHFKREEVVDLEAKLGKLQAAALQEQEDNKRKVKESVDQIELIEKEVSRSGSLAIELVQKSVVSLQQLELEYKQEVEACKEEQRLIQAEIGHTLDLVSDHKTFVSRVLAEGVQSMNALSCLIVE